MTAAMPLLEARQLTVSHRQPLRQEHIEAVHQLSLSIFAGETIAIVGESGCGKSSLARALLGLLPAASGSIHVRGRDVASMNAGERRHWRREVQLIFQDPHSALSPRRRIRQSLEEAMQVQGQARDSTAQTSIEAVLDEVNLATDVLQRYPHQLSGGQKQRVVMARALLCEPRLIVADEPLSSLDVSEQARLLQLMRRLREEKGIGFLLIAHDLAMVQQIADRVGVMYLGRLVELASAGQFFQSAAHPYSRALLQATRSNWDEQHIILPALDGEPPAAATPPAGCVFHPRCRLKLARCSHDAPATQILASAGREPLHQVQCHLYPEPAQPGQNP